jgi:hypothetical protein
MGSESNPIDLKLGKKWRSGDKNRAKNRYVALSWRSPSARRVILGMRRVGSP